MKCQKAGCKEDAEFIVVVISIDKDCNLTPPGYPGPVSDTRKLCKECLAEIYINMYGQVRP